MKEQSDNTGFRDGYEGTLDTSVYPTLQVHSVTDRGVCVYYLRPRCRIAVSFRVKLKCSHALYRAV